MKIENSKNIIRIKFDGFLSCLYIKEPKSADWPDCCGSVSRYYACFTAIEQDDEIRNQIEEKVSSVKSIEDLKNSGFLELLEEGEYDFELWKEKETCLIYCNEIISSTDLLDVRQKKNIDSLVASESISQYCFYPYGRQLMFTRPMETLDLKRVQFYEKEIANGSRPLAIAIRLKDINHIDEESYQNYDFNTIMYVLDGHHKLVAYNNLNINPSYIVINRIKNENLNSYDDSALPELEHYLFYYQIDHIIRHGIDYMKISDKLTNYIDDFLRNTERIKDTLIFTFYKNISTNQFQIDQYRRAWILERFQVLFNRMEKEERPLILDFFCQKTQNRRYELIKKWEEALELVIYDRNL